jgi:hypothetical protein
MVKCSSFDVDLQKLQIKSQVRTCADGVHKKLKQKGLMLVVLKWGSFDVALQKHQNKSQART